ncbi:MAG: hypothetical protein J4G03_08390 [Gemmatimonadetes bacterium]|nr:hypothetical protein [Gemmatimonadota bacterium]
MRWLHGAGRVVFLIVLSVSPAKAATQVTEKQMEDWALSRSSVVGVPATGGRKGEPEFSRIGSVLAWADRLYVGQPDENQFRIVSTAGADIGSLGGPGDGPGDFRRLGAIGRIGDYVWVADPVLNRVSFFDHTGKYTSSETVPRYLPDADGSLMPRAVFEDGSVLARRIVGDNVSVGSQGTEQILRIVNGGEVVDTLVAFGAPDAAVQIRDGVRGVANILRPVVDSPLWSGFPDGSGVLVVHRPARARVGAYYSRVLRLDVAADTVFDQWISYRPVPVSRSFLRRYAEARLRELDSIVTDAGRFREAALESFAAPDLFPPVDRTYINVEGLVWLKLRTGETSFEWCILDGMGRPIGRFKVPDNTRLAAGDREGVWLVETDQWDVPYLVRYTFVK